MTLATFLGMMQLVATPADIDSGPALRAVEFLRLQRPPEVPPQPELESEPQAEPPPAPKTLTIAAEPLPAPSLPRLDAGRLALGGLKLALDIRGQPYLGAMAPDPVAAPALEPSVLVPTRRVPPLYPRRALRRKLEGWVEVELTIAADGSVRDARVLRAKPSGTFERAALKAVRRWRFRPQTADAPLRATQKIEFRLDG